MNENKELYTCYWCEQEWPEDLMYDTGYNHDPICLVCDCIESEKLSDFERNNPGTTYVWLGDQKVLTRK